MSTSLSFADWSHQCLSLVLSKQSDSTILTQFHEYVNEVASSQFLAPPNADSTHSFLNELSVSLIDSILTTGQDSARHIPLYSREVLEPLSGLLGLLLCSDHTAFVRSATQILANPNHPIFQVDPACHTRCVNEFLDADVLRQCQSDADISFAKLKAIIALFRVFREHFRATDLDQFCVFAASAACRQFDRVPIRDVDERDFDACFETLEGFSTRGVRPQIAHFRFEVALKLAGSDLLGKQMSGVSTINKLMSDHYIVAKDVVALLDRLLSGELHHALVQDVSTMLGRVIRQLKSDYTALFRKYWTQTARSPPATIMVFLQGVQKLLTYIGPKHFFETVGAVGRYPDAVLHFIRQSAGWVDSTELQGTVFSALSDHFRAEGDGWTAERKELLVATAIAFFPKGDREYVSKVQDLCIDFITCDEYVDFAYPILAVAIAQLESEKADSYFDLFLAKMNEDTTRHLDLFVQIMRRMSRQLSEEQFEAVEAKIMELIDVDTAAVCKFWANLFDVTVERNPLTEEMNARLYHRICETQPFSPVLFHFVCHRYASFNPMEGITGLCEIEGIWQFLFQTGHHEVIDYLICCYQQPKNNELCKEFLMHCRNNLNCPGSLMAIRKLIQIGEDGLIPDMNRFFFEDEIIEVNLVGYLERTIRIYSGISWEGFVSVVSASINTTNFQLSRDGELLTQRGFSAQDKRPVHVEVSPDFPEQPTSFVHPHLILQETEYEDMLMTILMEGEEDVALLALDILNAIPVLRSQSDELNRWIDWKVFLCLEHAYLLLYRINMIGNHIKRNRKFATRFYEEKGLRTYFRIVINAVPSIFSTPETQLFFVRFANFLVGDIPNESCKQLALDRLRDPIEPLISWISDWVGTQEHELLQALLIFLRNFPDAGFDNEFVPIVNETLLHENEGVRAAICECIKIIPSLHRRLELTLPFISNERTVHCEQLFILLREIAEKPQMSDALWDKCRESLNDHFRMPDSADPIACLSFATPSERFTSSLFSLMRTVAPRIAEIERIEELISFITDNIVFNTYKFYRLTDDLMAFYTDLLRRAPHCTPEVVEQVEIIHAMPPSQSNTPLVAGSRPRGIINLGTTCYISSILQQLFRIDEFRHFVIRASAESDWFCELQYIMASLMCSPTSAIDIRSFVGVWRGVNGKLVDPHVQQDAAAFLSLLLNRLNGLFPELVQLFRGGIHQTIISCNDSSVLSESLKPFTTFPLEISGYHNVAESLRAFLAPDQIEYPLNGVKLTALRYHKVAELPPILVLQLKRFSDDVEPRRRTKLNTKFDYPLTLDLNEVLVDPSVDATYSLIGVVLHNGTPDGGHYFSYCLRNESKWICLNDAHYTNLSPPSVLQASGGIEDIYYASEVRRNIERGSSAYILFYRKQDAPSVPPYGPLDAALLERLRPDIARLIRSEIGSSPQFATFVSEVAFFDTSGRLTFRALLAQLPTPASATVFGQLTAQLSSVCSRDATFADFILERTDVSAQVLFECESADARDLYAEVIRAARGSCSHEKAAEFGKFLLGFLKENSARLMTHHQASPTFFALLSLFASSSAAYQIVHFLTHSLPSYDRKHESSDIFAKINLAGLFELLTTFGDSVDPIAVLTSASVPRMELNATNFRALRAFLSGYFSAHGSADSLLELLNPENNLPPACMAHIFAVLLENADPDYARRAVYNIGGCSELVILKTLASITQFAGLAVAPLAGAFIGQFLFSQSRAVREAARTFFVTQKQSRSALFRALIEMRPALAVRTSKSRSGAEVPTKEFFSAFRAVATEDDVREVAPALLDGYFVEDTLDVMVDVLGGSLFQRVPAAQLLALDVAGPTGLKLGRALPAGEIAQFVGTPAFAALLKWGLSEDVMRHVLRALEGPAQRVTLEQLWSPEVVRAHFPWGDILFLKVTWRVLKKEPSAAALFHERRLHERLFDEVRRVSQIGRQVLRVLAQFNESYAQIRGDARTMGLIGLTKRQKLFAFYKPNDQALHRWMFMNADSPIRVGRTGAFRFIASLATLNQEWVREIAKKLFHSKHAVWLTHKWNGVEHGIARLLVFAADLEPSDRAVKTFANEIANLPAEAHRLLDILCGGLISLANKLSGVWAPVRNPMREILIATQDLAAFGPNVEVAVKEGCTAMEAGPIVRNARQVINQAIVMGAAMPAEELRRHAEMVAATIGFVYNVAREFDLEDDSEAALAETEAREFVERVQEIDPSTARVIRDFCAPSPP